MTPKICSSTCHPPKSCTGTPARACVRARPPGRAPARLSYDAPGRRSPVDPPGSDRPWPVIPRRWRRVTSRSASRRSVPDPPIPRAPVPPGRRGDLDGSSRRRTTSSTPSGMPALLARDPRNAVRLDLPTTSPVTSPTSAIAGSRGRWPRGAPTGRSARTRGRRSTSTSRRIASPARTSGGPSAGSSRVVRLEPFGPGAGILPHERTMTGPKEDRYRLLRATGVNTRPIVALYEDRSGAGRDGARCGDRGRAVDRRGRRRRCPAPPVGRRRRRARPRVPVRACARRASAGARSDRRWPPPLRDGAALPRRAADERARARRTRRSTMP